MRAPRETGLEPAGQGLHAVYGALYRSAGQGAGWRSPYRRGEPSYLTTCVWLGSDAGG